MKNLLLSFSSVALFAINSNAQCTPTQCTGLPAYGGVCDTVLIDATVSQAFSDFESFMLNNQCFDAGLIDPSQSGTQIRILGLKQFTYAGFPNGLTGQTSQQTYTPTGGNNLWGCLNVTGTPTEIGLFNLQMNFLADVQMCSFPGLTLPDNEAGYDIWVTVKPNPSFTGLASNYCITDGAVNLTVTGTTGGVFSGPGITGNQFNPATAGVGAHEIKYLVSRMEGAAVAAAADSMIVLVEVFEDGTVFFEDADNDGYGDPNSTATGCTIPSGFVSNNDDCDDTDPNLYPNAPGFDENCLPSTAGLNSEESVELVLYPNPNNGQLHIKSASLIKEVVIIDLNGRVVSTISANTKVLHTEVSSLENGMYVVRVISEAGIAQERLLIQK
jgi:hypothetical protein